MTSGVESDLMAEGLEPADRAAGLAERTSAALSVLWQRSRQGTYRECSDTWPRRQARIVAS
ncbi:hypothetical protein [Streptomyces sp. NBC_00829]|uniref:hypothetical protein n=1 Tax=Streptomyces sp. NBC_00829 TaxID=2903679 RepID=UPI003869EB44|nr:hypothetical protein OG293_12485 [Streptomyces sp. NBC_00829]